MARRGSPRKLVGVTIKERLHELVDELSEREADEALRYIAQRREDSMIAAFRDAPEDDEPVTAADEQALAEVQADRAAGVPRISHAEDQAQARLSVTSEPWSIEFERRADRDLERLDPQIKQRVLALAALDRLAGDPQGAALLKLKGRAESRLRVGDWRVILELDISARTIVIQRILPLGRAYDR